jgi:hypothetical protein
MKSIFAPQELTHSLQIYTLGPAMSFLTSLCPLLQKLQRSFEVRVKDARAHSFISLPQVMEGGHILLIKVSPDPKPHRL